MTTDWTIETQLDAQVPQCAMSCQQEALIQDGCSDYQDSKYREASHSALTIVIVACHCANTGLIGSLLVPCLASTDCTQDDLTKLLDIVNPICAYFNATSSGEIAKPVCDGPATIPIPENAVATETSECPASEPTTEAASEPSTAVAVGSGSFIPSVIPTLNVVPVSSPTVTLSVLGGSSAATAVVQKVTSTSSSSAYTGPKATGNAAAGVLPNAVGGVLALLGAVVAL
jgi:hypothetical protein